MLSCRNEVVSCIRKFYIRRINSTKNMENHLREYFRLPEDLTMLFFASRADRGGRVFQIRL